MSHMAPNALVTVALLGTETRGSLGITVASLAPGSVRDLYEGNKAGSERVALFSCLHAYAVHTQ